MVPRQVIYYGHRVNYLTERATFYPREAYQQLIDANNQVISSGLCLFFI